jgi:methyltransferase FkbM-like protein
MAVTDREGEIGFLEGDNPSTGRADSAGAQVVSATSLDSFVYDGGNRPPQMIKMDIEGGEFAALLGAARVLRESRPLIFLATHGAEVHRDCLKLLRESGYDATSLDEKDVESTAELCARPKDGHKARI